MACVLSVILLNKSTGVCLYTIHIELFSTGGRWGYPAGR